MASSYTQIYQYRDPSKVDLSSTFQAQSYKQQNYDINTQQTQQLINQYAGTDLLKDVDKEYFGQRLNTLVGFINQSGTRDWSRKSISNELQNYVSGSLDKNVMNAIASTQSFRKQQAEIADIKKNKPGDYSMQNEWFATQDIQRYLGSKEAGDTYHAQSYVPYTDVKKIILDNSDKLKEFGMEYHTSPIGGNSYFTKVGTFEKIDPEKAKEYLSTIMDAKVMNQLYIDGQYSYKDTKPEVIKEKFIAKLDSYDKVYSERLTELKTLSLGATRDKKAEYANTISVLENNRNELNKQRNQDLSPQATADYLYRTDFENKWTGFLSFNRLKDYKIDDSGFKIKQHQDDINLKNRDYNQRVNEFKYKVMNDTADRAQNDAQFNAKMEVDGWKKQTDGTYGYVGGPNSGITPTDIPKELQEERLANPITTAENDWNQSAVDVRDIVAKQLKQTVNNGQNPFYADKLQNANFERISNLLINRPDQYTKLYALLTPESKKIIDQAKSNKLKLTAIDNNLNSIKEDMITIGTAAMKKETKIGTAAMEKGTKASTKEMFRSNSYGYTINESGNLTAGDVLSGSHKYSDVARVITQVNSLLKSGSLSADDETAYRRLMNKTMVESGMSVKQMKNVSDKMIFTKTYSGKMDAALQFAADSALNVPGIGNIAKGLLKINQGIFNLFDSSDKPFTFADDAISKANSANHNNNKRGISGEILDRYGMSNIFETNKDFDSLGGQSIVSDSDIAELKDGSGKVFNPSSIMTRWGDQLNTAKTTLAKNQTTTFDKAFNIDMASKDGQAMRGTFMALMPVGTDLQKDSNVQVTLDKETGMANITAAVKQGKEYAPVTFQSKIEELPKGLLSQLDLSEKNNLYSASNKYSINYQNQTELPRTIDEWREKIESLPFNEREEALKNPPKTQQSMLRDLDLNYGSEIVDKNMEKIQKIMDAPYKIENLIDNGQWSVKVSQNGIPIMQQRTNHDYYEPDLMDKASNKILTEVITNRIKETLSNGRN